MAEQDERIAKADETKADGKQAEAAEQPTKYTDADVDRIVARKFAKWQADQEAKVAEAKKLAEMNATEKAAYQLKKANERIAELEVERTRREMAREVREQLREAGIDAPDAVVSVLVGNDAEATKAATDAFSEAFSVAVEAAVKERLAGRAPRSQGSAPTRESILAIKDRRARQKAIAENIELFD